MRKIWTLAITLLLILCILPVAAQAETVASGTCGENATYTLSDDGFLTISGTGAMADYAAASDCPWYAQREQILSVVIEDGVTAIGDRAFYSCTALKKVNLGSGITSIGEFAFYSCTALKEVNIPAAVTLLEDSSFRACTELTKVIFGGNAPAMGNYVFNEGAAVLTIYYHEGSSGYDQVGWSVYTHETMHVGTWVIDVAATCTSDGRRHIECSYCSTTITEVIPGGHNYEDGICTVCQEVEIIDSGTLGTNLAWQLDALGVLSISGTGAMPDYSTSTNAPWYTHRTQIETIEIGSGVTTIGAYSFYACTALTEFTFPANVVSVGTYAFKSCTGLTELVVPETVTNIGLGAFNACANLTSITIPFVGGTVKNHAETYQYPFGYIFGTSSYTGGTSTLQYYHGSSASSTTSTSYYIPTALRSVTVTGGYLLRGAFYNCSNLTSVSFLEDVITIGSYAFYNCSSLTSFTLPTNTVNINEYAFYGCSSLTGMTIPASVTLIGKYAFYNCSAMASANIPEGITVINERSFYGCSSLTEIRIPESVQTIGTFAFARCAFTEVEIPDSVTSIGAGVFSGCASLESITIPFVGESVKTATDTNRYPFGYIFGTSSYTGGTSTSQSYYGSSTTSTTSSTYYIPTVLTSVTVTGGDIFRGAFQNCRNLEEIVLSEDVTTIPDYAFYKCAALTELDIPSGVTSIGGYAFQDCTGITELVIPGGVSSFGTYAFDGCTALTSCNIPEGTATIPNYLFADCSALESITIPESVSSIGDYAFDHCSALEEILIPDSVLTIGAYAFRGCSGLTNVVVPESVTSIGSAAFGACSGLTSITVPFVGGSVKTSTDTYQYPFGYLFGTSSYTGGTGVSQAYYGSGTTSTTTATFYIPTSLRSVTVTGGNILYGAFKNCSMLTSIIIPGNITGIGSYAFSGCSGLKAITIADTVSTIDSYAFDSCNALSTVFYRGTEAGRDNITVRTNNEPLDAATWHYQITDVTLNGVKAYHCGKCGFRFLPDGSYAPLAQLEIVTLPTNQNTVIDGSIDVEGISLRGTYADGLTVTLGADFVESVTADLTTIGAKTATVTALGATAEFTVYVHTVDNSYTLIDSTEYPYPESDHNYSNSITSTQTFTYPGAESLELTFSEETEVESGYDYLYLYDGSGTQIARYTGTSAAGLVVVIPGDTFQVKLTTDGSSVRYGYSFSSIRAGMNEMVHPPVIDPATATCTGPGLTEGSHCEICGMILVAQEEVEALDHSYETVETPPTCTEDGSITYTCTACGDTYTEPGLAALGHDWADADCVNPMTCLNCGDTEGDPLGHDYLEDIYPATCTEDGYTVFTCTRCQDTYTGDEVEATGHDWQEANCRDPRTCRNCGLTEGEPGDHQYEPVVTEATCTQDGYTTYTCPGCGDSYVDNYVEATGHSWVDATCTEPVTCLSCGLTDGDPLGHDYEITYREPTCTEEGGTYHICGNCGDSFVEDAVPATGHDWQEASCAAPETCRNCDETRGDPLPHDYEDSVTPPTCTEDGYTLHTCRVCGYSSTDNYVEATGHSWVAATCTVPDTCSVCGATQGEPLGHDYQNGECTRCHEEEPEMDGVIRLAGANRYATGFAIANQLKENMGVDRFEAVVVAYGLNFPDALTGSYLAAVKNAPILLTDPSVDSQVLAYLQNNLAAGGRVYILGGEAAVSRTFEVAAQSAGFSVKRLKGAGRYETNLEILREAGVNATDEILIATGKNYADSLSASATGLPMLLVDKNLTDSQRSFLQGTSKKFVILGGTGAVSAEIEAELDAIGEVSRVKGSNRYLTSVLIARKYFPNARAAVLAYAQGFPDGLCGGPLALSMGAPLILTSNESPDAADGYVVGISSGAVTGGTGRISDETVRDIFELPADTPIPKF